MCIMRFCGGTCKKRTTQARRKTKAGIEPLSRITVEAMVHIWDRVKIAVTRLKLRDGRIKGIVLMISQNLVRSVLWLERMN